MYSKLSEEQILRKVTESLYISLTTTDEIEKYVNIMQSNSSNKYIHRSNFNILNLFDRELQLINTKPMIKDKLKELLSELKKLKINDRKIFHSSTKLIACDSDIDEAFKSMHQSIMTKIKNYPSED